MLIYQNISKKKNGEIEFIVRIHIKLKVAWKGNSNNY